MKTFLKAFSQQYRIKEELDTEEVQFCLDIVENDRIRRSLAKEAAESMEEQEFENKF